MKREYFISIIFLLLSFISHAQTDTVFWFVAPEISSFNSYDRPIYLRLTAQSQAANVTITQPASASFGVISRSISAYQTVTVDLSSKIDSVENKPANTVLNRGLLIRSNVPISAYYEVAATVNPDIFVLKGKQALGNEFYIPTQNIYPNNSSYSPPANNAFDIVAIEDNTTVSITPSQNIIGHTAGITFNKVLNKGQTYSAVASSQAAGGHLIGSKVTSTKPIAVTIKDDLLANSVCSDLQGDQLVPTSIIVTDYVVVKGSLSTNDAVYIIGTKNNTGIYLNGSSTAITTINAGQYYVYSLSAAVVNIHTSQPVYVYHNTGHGCEIGGALLPGITCTGSNRVSIVRTTNESFYVNLVTTSSAKDSFQVNGSYGIINGSSFSSVPGSATLMYAYIDLSSQITVGNPAMITNRVGSFSLGVIHGGSATGTRYGYFSGYSSLYLGPDFNMCQGNKMTLNAGEGGTSYLWNTGDTVQKIQVTASGTYWVRKIQNSCTLYDTIKVTTIPMPDAGFNVTSDTIQCSNSNVFTFQNTSSISSGTMSYLWKFGDDSISSATNPSHTYRKSYMPGQYLVTLIASSKDGCQDSIRKRVFTRSIPKVKYSINDSNQCLQGNKFIFSDSTTMLITTLGGSISGYLYKFGDFTSSTQQNPIHSYSSLGFYRTTLTVTTTFNCLDSVVKHVIVQATPSVSFTINDTLQCLPANSFEFESKSTITPGSIASTIWDFGDTTTGNGTLVTHNYTKVNKYKVKLKVTSDNGCSDSLTKNVHVVPKPKPSFVVDDSSQCLNSNSFLFTSSTIPAQGYSYQWKFGDGATATGMSVSHSYNSTGVKNVTLTVVAGNCRDSITRQVVVTIPPNANFTINSTRHCLDNNLIVFTNTSAYGGTGTLKFKWLFGDGDSAKVKDTSHTYKAVGGYSVKLFAITPDGCIDSIAKGFTIHPNPVSFFRFDGDSSLCVLTNVYKFKNLSTGGTAGGILWDFADGVTSTAFEPTHTFTTAGNYRVLLKITNSFGCDDTFSRLAIVRPVPVASFTIDNDTQCLNGNNFNFTNTSKVTGFLRSDLWAFGDNTTSPLLNPTHVYTSSGTFTIKLTLITPGGCNDTVYGSVTVLPVPGAKFSVDDTVKCPNLGRTFRFTNLTPNPFPPVPITYFWDFGDPPATSTLKNPIYTYLKPGIYDVKLIARNSTNFCADTHTVTVVAAARPSVYFKNYDSIQCFDRNLFHFTNLSAVLFGSMKYLWNFGDGDTSTIYSPTHHYAMIDTYTVKLIGTSNYGCIDSFKWHTFLKNGVRPVAAFTANDTAQCLKGNNFILTNTSTISTGNINSQIWNFDDGDTSHKYNVSHSYLVEGIKKVKLFITSDGGCTDSVIHPMLVSPKPRVSFVPNDSTQCLNENVFVYNNTTSITMGSYTSFWDFDDGANSTIKSPTHTFSQINTFNVKLRVVSDQGCNDSITHTSLIFPIPVAKLELKSDTVQCFKSNSFSFSDKSTMSGGTIIANLWRYDDGNSAMNVPNPVYSYSNTGTYNVTLVVASNEICYDTANVVVSVFNGPTVEFTVNDSTQCLSGNNFIFTNNSSIVSDTLSYLWKFGDGDTSTLIDPVHSYALQDTFNVMLVAKSSHGCSDSMSHNMFVANQQKVDFTINDSDQCLSNNFFRFTNTTVPMIPGTVYFWEFGNGDTSTAVNPSYIYSSTGTFSVKLKIITGLGCDDSIIKNVYVSLPQQTSFTIVNDTIQCLSGNSFIFNNTSSIPSGTLTYLWDFGNNQTSTLTNPTFSFSTDGTHPVKLKSFSSQGCIDSFTRNVYIMPAQTTSFTVNDTSQCIAGNQFNFTNTSSFPSGTLTYLWDFGNGNTSASPNISYSYIVKGKYTVKLISMSSINCSDSAFQDVYVGDPPTAGFGVNDTSQCLGGNVFVFSNQSTAGSGTVISGYIWYFGDGNTSILTSPNYSYPTTDTFTVKLVAISAGGCDDSISRQVYVRPMPKAGFSINTNPQNLFGNNFVFTNTTSISYGNYNSAWDFGDGNTSTSSNPTHSYATADTFTVKLIITSDYGCSDTITRLAYVTSGPPPGITVSFTYQNACVGDTVLFINTSTVTSDSFMNFFWDFGDTIQAIIRTNPKHIYKYTGTYLVKLKGVTWGGLQDSTSQFITIYDKPTLSISYAPAKTGIVGEKITLTANGTYNTLLWSTGEQTSSILVDKTGFYAVKASNINNCSTSDSIFIEFINEQSLDAMTLITPNGDGYNDYFKILNIDIFRPLKVVIYNRWGNELYSSEDYQNEWDGKYKGKELPEGTYFYVIIDKNGMVHKGAISIVQDGY